MDPLKRDSFETWNVLGDNKFPKMLCFVNWNPVIKEVKHKNLLYFNRALYLSSTLWWPAENFQFSLQVTHTYTYTRKYTHAYTEKFQSAAAIRTGYHDDEAREEYRLPRDPERPFVRFAATDRVK